MTLEPKIIGHQMGLSPIATLLCIFAGGKLLGLTGIFLFPIAATVLAELHRGKGKGPGRCPACRQKGYHGIQDSFD